MRWKLCPAGGEAELISLRMRVRITLMSYFLPCFASSCLALPCHVLSYLVMSCLCLDLTCLALSNLVLSCLVLSRLVLPCLVLSCVVLSCLVLSCLALPCVVLTCLKRSAPITVSLVLSHKAVSSLQATTFTTIVQNVFNNGSRDEV